MKITGQLLKSERLNKDISVQEAAAALKLSVKIITSLEAGDMQSLPAKTFVRGFVKSYAEYLKLDPNMVLRQFQEEMGTTSPLPKVPPPQPSLPGENIKAARPAIRHTSQSHSAQDPVRTSPLQQKKMQEDSVNNKIAIFISGAILLVAVLVISAKLFNSIGADSTPVTQTQNNSAPIVPRYDVDPNAIAPQDDSNHPAAAAEPNLPSAPVAATSNPAPESPAVAAAPIATAPPAISLDEEYPPSPGKPVELMIEAKKDIEIYYAKGNTKLFKSLKIPQHQLQIIRSSTGLHIKAADGGSLRLTVNGIETGFAGPANKQVKLSF